MTRRTREMQSLIKNSTPHNSNRLCPNTFAIVMISHTDVIPKPGDDFDVGTQIVLNFYCNWKVSEIETARFLNAFIPRVNRELICNSMRNLNSQASRDLNGRKWSWMSLVQCFNVVQMVDNGSSHPRGIVPSHPTKVFVKNIHNISDG